MAERQSLPTQIATYAGVATIAAGLLDGLHGFETYISDITAQDPESYARLDAMHAAFPWTQAPSLTEAYAQLSATNPDVSTTQTFLDQLTNLGHIGTIFPEVAAAVCCLAALVTAGYLFRNDLKRLVPGDHPSSRRNRPN